MKIVADNTVPFLKGIAEPFAEVVYLDSKAFTPEAVRDAVTATIDELQEFFVSLGMPRTLGELGVTEGDIDQLLDGLKINRGERFGSFKQLTLEDARAIYCSAL